MHYKVNIFYMQLSKIKQNKICNEDTICRQIRINAACALSIMHRASLALIFYGILYKPAFKCGCNLFIYFIYLFLLYLNYMKASKEDSI